LFRFHNNEFDAMPCELNSIEYTHSFQTKSNPVLKTMKATPIKPGIYFQKSPGSQHPCTASLQDCEVSLLLLSLCPFNPNPGKRCDDVTESSHLYLIQKDVKISRKGSKTKLKSGSAESSRIWNVTFCHETVNSEIFQVCSFRHHHQANCGLAQMEPPGPGLATG